MAKRRRVSRMVRVCVAQYGVAREQQRATGSSPMVFSVKLKTAVPMVCSVVADILLRRRSTRSVLVVERRPRGEYHGGSTWNETEFPFPVLCGW